MALHNKTLTENRSLNFAKFIEFNICELINYIIGHSLFKIEANTTKGINLIKNRNKYYKVRSEPLQSSLDLRYYKVRLML